MKWKMRKTVIHLIMLSVRFGRDSSVCIVTHYTLDGPGIESRWERDFPHLYILALRPTASYTMGIWSLPGVNWPGSGVDLPRHLDSSLKKEYSITLPLGLQSRLQGELYLLQ